MTMDESNPYASLNRIFHEPNRLAIMSALGGSGGGLTFNDLKAQCNLTDGNLSRHLKTLEEAGAIKVRKSFAGSRPRTTVLLSNLGREGFIDYLKTLEEVLVKAAEALAPEPKAQHLRAFWQNQLTSRFLDTD